MFARSSAVRLHPSDWNAILLAADQSLVKQLWLMKIVLVSLDGDAGWALERLHDRFPGAMVETVSRTDFEAGNMRQRLAALRARKPRVFAVATHRLEWQRGQTAFMLFGALAGARRSVLLDANGGWRSAKRFSLLATAPIRLADETIASRSLLRRSAAEISRLLQICAKSDRYDLPPGERMPPRIAYLRATPGPGTQIGGASSHINGFVNAALARSATIQFSSNDAIPGLDKERTDLSIIGPEPFGATRAAFDLHNNYVFLRGAVPRVAEFKPEFIYQRYARFSWVGVEASLRTRRPLFLEYNGSEVWVGKHWDKVGNLDLLRRCEELNLAAAAKIFVVSEVERKKLLEAGVPGNKIVVNPNGVDPEKFRPDAGGAGVRAQYKIANHEVLVGFTGTFGPWHGVLALAEAIARTPVHSHLRFLLIGSGSLRGEVERIIGEAGLADRAIFAGVVDHDRVPAMLDACDILVSPHVPMADGSAFFGSPTKLFEYMAMGKAIVASRLGQIGEVLADNENAVMVEPGNVDELTAAITRLASHPTERRRLGAAARATAIAHHTWDQNAGRVLDAFRDLSN
jgi:glycosyltransferase involved in cell wall biosynthesis